MPVHDWGPVRVNLFHHFHQSWTCTLIDTLNNGELPCGYFALIPMPNPPVSRDEERQSDSIAYAARANRIAVHGSEGELVAMIEIVSPGNKSSEKAIEQFVTKTTEFLERGVNLLVVDVFPPTKRDPHGIHKAIWDEFLEEDFELPGRKPLTAASYVAEVPRTAYVENFAVGDPLPPMPVFLDADRYVYAPLEETYQTTWNRCPEEFRGFVRSAGKK